jgi:hypothetical protein
MGVWKPQERTFRVREGQLGRMADGRFLGSGANFLNERAELFEDVVDGLNQAGTVADQAMAAPARQAVGRTGDGEDFAVLFHGVRGGRQRSAAWGCFDNEHAER